jgi:hypothetical protein
MKQTSSIFSIDKAEQYFCSLFRYSRGHSQLYLSLRSEDNDQLYIFFPSTLYFAGPYIWKGANFREESQEVLSLLLQGTESFDGMSFKDRHYHLFTIEKPRLSVKIISLNPEIMRELPND